jgi:hypothetical protein
MQSCFEIIKVVFGFYEMKNIVAMYMRITFGVARQSKRHGRAYHVERIAARRQVIFQFDRDRQKAVE